MVVCSDSWHQTLPNFEQLLYLHWNNLCIIQLWHGIFSFHPFGQTPQFPNYFHSFPRYSGGTGPDATCAGSGVAVFGWGTINHWGGGSFASQFARSVVPQCLAWCPHQGRQLCETQLYSLLGICIRSPVAPHLGPSQFFFQLSISAESCLAGPVNVSKWCLKYVPRATLSSLRSLVSTLFQKKRKGSVFAIGLGIFYQHLVFFPVYLLYPKMVLNWVAQYYANLQFWGLFTTE